MVINLHATKWLGKASKLEINGEETIQLLVDAVVLCRNTESVEQTKRLEITANRDTKIAEVKAKKDLLESYMKSAFDERADLIDGFFKRLDTAIEKEDHRLLEQSICAILAVAKQSPLLHSRELIAAINNPDVDVIDI